LAVFPGELYYNVSSKSMGKRELLLILVFAIAGALVYHTTAPPPAPGERSFSFGQMVDHVRRELRGNRASAESTATTHHPVDAAISELKVNSRMGELTIVGENRTDIEAELRVRSNGFDEAEAKRLVGETKLQIEGSGRRLVAGVVYPRAGTQRTLRLTLKVPARLQVILDARGGPMNVSGVAAIELSSPRGETRIRKIPGKVTGSFGGGELLIADTASVTIETNSAEVRLERITAETNIRLRSGELRATDLEGAIEIDSQNADVLLEKVEKATAVLKIKAVSGSVTVKELQTEARIDVRNAEVDVVAAQRAPLAIYSEDGGSIDVTPAPGGYQLDAMSQGGNLTVPEKTVETVNTTGEGRRATGPVDGGGPLLTIRSARADIRVRPR